MQWELKIKLHFFKGKQGQGNKSDQQLLKYQHFAKHCTLSWLTIPLLFLVPPKFTTKPSSLKWTTTEPIELKCAASGSPVPSLSWLKNGNELSSQDAAKVRYYEGGAILTISSVTSSDSGMYQCLAENNVGNAQATASVIVHRSGEIIVIQTFLDVCRVNYQLHKKRKQIVVVLLLYIG